MILKLDKILLSGKARFDASSENELFSRAFKTDESMKNNVL
jgi:hypothetical protein